jgi:hypothetical protein
MLLIKRHEETNRTPDRIDFGILPTTERTECWLVIASTTMRYVRAKQGRNCARQSSGGRPSENRFHFVASTLHGGLNARKTALNIG